MPHQQANSRKGKKDKDLGWEQMADWFTGETTRQVSPREAGSKESAGRSCNEG